MNRGRVEKVMALCEEVRNLGFDALGSADESLEALNELLEETGAETVDPSYTNRIEYTKESAALRRRSMDLTRALADMRRPQ